MHFHPALLVTVVTMLFLPSARAEPTVLNQQADGYRGIWYMNQPSGDEYVFKYSGGLGTYCAKHRPLAIYRPEVNKTFFCYGGTTTGSHERHDPGELAKGRSFERGRPGYLQHMVSYYDHATGTVPRPTILLDKHTADAHDNPVLSIDADGHLWIFSTSHGTSRPSFIHRSIRPYDITGFERVPATRSKGDQNILIDNFSYMQPWHVKDEGFIAFFTRYNYPAQRTICYMTSPDGVTWSAWNRLAVMGTGHYQISATHNKRAGTAFNRHTNGANTRTDLYYLQTDDFGQSWHTADGTPATIPLKDTAHPARIHDYHAEKLHVYLKDITYDTNGHPVILYLTSPGYQAGPRNSPRTWTTARWTGSNWQIRPITTSDSNYDTGSLHIAGDGSWHLVAPTRAGPQKFNPGGEMVLWFSRDQGHTWRSTRQLTSGSSRNHTYARRPLNAHPDFQALWADGDARSPSTSSLYFSNQAGEVFVLPETMDEADATPRRFAPATPPNLQTKNLVPWCIVPFDATKRNPDQRARMLKELGLTRCAYDWRAEHVPQFEQEILAYRKHGIDMVAFWGEHEDAFRLFKKYDLHPQIWITAPSPKAPTRAERITAAADALEPLAKRTAILDCPLGLYNHGNWGGEPANLVALCEELHRRGYSHAGIIYNWHHGHDQIADWSESLKLLQPHLLCLNLNGMNSNASPKILPLGEGQHEQAMLQAVIASGYDGPVGIIDHLPDTDTKATLLGNIEGLRALLKKESSPGQPGLAAKHPGDRNIASHPAVLLNSTFESDDWRKPWNGGERATVSLVNSDPDRQFTPLQGKALRIAVRKGEHYGASIEHNFRKTPTGEPEEIYFRYYIRLGDDWNPHHGGKLPGIAGTYGKAGWGGRPSNGHNGWSARGLFNRSENKTTQVGFYCYHAAMKGRYGEHWEWKQNDRGALENNRWYCIEQYAKLNTPGKQDGILRAWVDGKIAFEKSDVRMRDVPELKIETIWINFYHGGRSPATSDDHVYIDNLVIAREYIGPMISTQD